MTDLVAVPTLAYWPHQAALLDCGHSRLMDMGEFCAAPSDLVGCGTFCRRCYRETLTAKDDCYREILRLYPATVVPDQGGS